MEEFFHLLLGHPPTSIRCYDGAGSRRSFQSRIEAEAFGSGAAALVPYKPLRAMITEGRAAGEIAAHFRVSKDLVLFRSKRTKLYRQLSQN